MEIIVLCPQCERGLRVPDLYLGKRVKCPACGRIVETARSDETPAPQPVPARSPAPPHRPTPGIAPAVADVVEPSGSESWTFRVKVLADSTKVVKGMYRARLVPGGLELSKGRSEPFWIPVGTPACYERACLFTAQWNGRDVKFGIAQLNLYQNQLAQDLVEYLQGRRSRLDRDDYTMPWFLTLAVYLPIGIAFVGILGGAVGGGIAGGIAGGLVTANLAVVRNQRWALPTRLALCLGVNGIGYGLLALAIVGLMARLKPQNAVPAPLNVAPAIVPAFPKALTPPPVVVRKPAPPPIPSATRRAITPWGTLTDPSGDCTVAADGHSATFDVPGTVHNLMVGPGRTTAPRLLRPVVGDFSATVQVSDASLPVDPPAPTSDIAFHGAGLLLWQDAGNFIRLERAAFVRNGQLVQYVLFEHHQTGGVTDSQDTPYGGGPVSLRLEQRGPRVDAAFSTDGQSWRPLRPKMFPVAHAQVGVAAVNTASAPFRVRFDGLTIGKP